MYSWFGIITWFLTDKTGFNLHSDSGRVRVWRESGRPEQLVFASRLNIARTTVRRIINLYREIGRTDRRQGTGNPRVVNVREERHIANFVCSNWTVSVKALWDRFLRTYRRVISSTNIKKRRSATYLRSRWSLRVPRLLPRHKAA